MNEASGVEHLELQAGMEMATPSCDFNVVTTATVMLLVLSPGSHQDRIFSPEPEGMWEHSAMLEGLHWL